MPAPASRILEMEGIGPVMLERSSRAKRITMTIRPTKGIRVAVPRRFSFNEAAAFVREKRPWLEKTLSSLAEQREQHRPLAELYTATDKKKADTFLRHRLQELAEKHGLEYNRVTIREQRSRWGSCSHRNTISLNRRLIVLPPELRDYVILHELVHTRVHNHSARFWAELQQHLPAARKHAARLRDYDLRLFD